MKHSDAEAELDRELDESRDLRRIPPPGRHRAVYSLLAVIVISALGGVAAYTIASIVKRLGASPTWTFVFAGLVIAALAWGLSGISGSRVTATDRCVDAAVSAIVAPLVMFTPGLFNPADGIAGLPRFHHVLAWSAVAACLAFAGAALLRLAVEHRRA